MWRAKRERKRRKKRDLKSSIASMSVEDEKDLDS